MAVQLTASPTAQRWDEEGIERFCKALDRRMAAAVSAVEQTPVWRAVMDAETHLSFLRAIMREIYLEIYSYQPTSTEAIIGMIGKMPKTEPKMMRTMLLHQVDEADHGEMALKDYVALGGDETLPGPAAAALRPWCSTGCGGSCSGPKTRSPTSAPCIRSRE